MNFYILRHAIAVSRETDDYEDENRPLTKEGTRKMKAGAKGMRRLGLEIGRILSSPYARARQTADIVAEVFELKVELCRPLIPGAGHRELIAQLVKVREDNILLVGHEPHLSEFASVLVCGSTGAQLELKKGALCKLSSDHLIYGQCATLEWMLAPAQLRKLS
jgi:phosphohistidine phosphatase